MIALTENRDMLGAMIAVLGTDRWRLKQYDMILGSYQNRQGGRLESECLGCEGFTREVRKGSASVTGDVESKNNSGNFLSV